MSKERERDEVKRDRETRGIFLSCRMEGEVMYVRARMYVCLCVYKGDRQADREREREREGDGERGCVM